MTPEPLPSYGSHDNIIEAMDIIHKTLRALDVPFVVMVGVPYDRKTYTTSNLVEWGGDAIENMTLALKDEIREVIEERECEERECEERENEEREQDDDAH